MEIKKGLTLGLIHDLYENTSGNQIESVSQPLGLPKGHHSSQSVSG